MIYKNKVYDVTKFVQEHPGGPAYIIDYAGNDISTAYDDVGHSEYSAELMLEYYVGEVDRSDILDEEDSVPTDTTKKWLHAAKLTKKVKMSHNSYIFTYKFKEEFNLDLIPGQHISFVADIDGKSVSRPYTPIECRPVTSELDCLIKIYPEGVMSQYLDK